MSSNQITKTILEQLGGNKFIAMTGSEPLLVRGNTLPMTLAKNVSKANRLHITLEADDTYTMRFFYYSQGRLNHRTRVWMPEKTVEVAKYEGVYAEDLCRIFKSVTGLDTRL